MYIYLCNSFNLRPLGVHRLAGGVHGYNFLVIRFRCFEHRLSGQSLGAAGIVVSIV